MDENSMIKTKRETKQRRRHERKPNVSPNDVLVRSGEWQPGQIKIYFLYFLFKCHSAVDFRFHC